MSSTKWVFLPLIALGALGMVAGCGGGDGPSGSVNVGPVEGRLPPGFPSDFPLYPGMEIVRSTPLGSRYVIEAVSEDEIGAVIDFYESALASEPWEILTPEPTMEAGGRAFRFSGPGFNQEGRVAIVEGLEGQGTGVGIVMPFEAFEEP